MSDFLTKYHNNKCNDEELEAVVELLLSSEKKEDLNKQMKEHWSKTTNDGDVPDLINNLYRIHYRISKNETSDVKKQNLIQYFSRIAAILILPITIAFGYLLIENTSVEQRMQTISSPMASRTSFELPDGSKVWLNAGSTISFPDHFSKNSRLVRLSGQAYFDVQKDKVPFQVETNNFTVNVLGTAFDVSAYQGEDGTVTLVRGKVNVGTSANNNAILIPGEQATINMNNALLKKRMVDPKVYISWKDNLLVFIDEPLENVIQRLERWYNLDIAIVDESIKQIHVTGTFQYESINEILQLIEITNSIKYSYDQKERKIELMHK